MNRMVAKIYLRLGLTSEKEVLKDMAEHYDGLVINANITAYYRSWVSSFLKEINKPYFIDPTTYIYAIDPTPLSNEQAITNKKSYGELSECFPESIQNIINERPLLPLDLMKDQSINKKLLRKIANNFIRFQKNITIKDLAQKRIDEYESWFSEEKEKQQEESILKFVSPPYFFINSFDDPWYKINLEIQLQTKQLEKEKPVYAILCLSEEILLEDNSVERILEDFSIFDGFVIWIDNFDERKEKSETLYILTNLVKLIETKNKESIILYGGYFSMLLSYKGLDICCRNIDYGEKKRVGFIPKGGGFPKKYYIPQIQSSLSKAKTRVLLSNHPNLICSCEICNGYKKLISKENNSIKGISDFFDMFDFKNDTKRHFILNIASEQSEIKVESLDNVIDKREKEVSKLYECQIPERIGIDLKYLQRWKEALLAEEEQKKIS